MTCLRRTCAGVLTTIGAALGSIPSSTEPGNPVPYRLTRRHRERRLVDFAGIEVCDRWSSRDNRV